MKPKLKKIKFLSRPDWQFLGLCGFLAIVFLTGGGSRADISSLVFLRPLSVLICALAFWKLNWGQVKKYSFLFWIAAAIISLVIMHLIPLPPALWQMLPGRGIIVEIDGKTGLGDVWRPLSMVPGETWNALYSLFTPLAVLLLAVQISREQRFDLLKLIIAIGLLSGFLGILQIVGDSKGPAYLYRITNNGSAVGLFANRNHQAVLLAMLFPMLAVYACNGIKSAQQLNIRGALALAGGAILIPLILVTGSRAGLIASVGGLVAAILLYRKPKDELTRKRGRKKLEWKYPLIGLTAIALCGLTIIMARAEAIQRLLQKGTNEGLRFDTAPLLIKEAWSYFPFGSGIGSFVEIYKMIEPDALLGPAYFNHAHNDWLEVFLTGGLPALAIVVAVIFALVRQGVGVFRSYRQQTRELAFGGLGLSCIIIFGITSAADYPLRVPALMCVFVICALWLHDALRSSHKKTGSLEQA